MRTPTIHLHGSDRQTLLTNYQTALTAVEQAMLAVRRCAPHGRDYVMQQATPGYRGDASVEAMNEHRARVESLLALHIDFEILVKSVTIKEPV